MKLAIEDILIRRDMYAHNAEVAILEGDVEEYHRLYKISGELDDVLMILEDRES